MIFVDSRAGSKELIRHPPLSDPRIATLTLLDSADVMFTGNGPHGDVLIGVEVKSLFDLISSADTGRLQATQIPAMLDEYDFSYLVYYGVYRPCPRSGALQIRRGGQWRGYSLGKRPIPYSYIESLLHTIAGSGVRVTHIPFMNTPKSPRKDDREEGNRVVATWIWTLHQWWSKPWSGHQGMRTFDDSGAPSLMPQMGETQKLVARMASCLPGIKFERAMAISKTFSSPREMACAEKEEFSEIATVSAKGRRTRIGPVLAEAIVRALRGE